MLARSKVSGEQSGSHLVHGDTLSNTSTVSATLESV